MLTMDGDVAAFQADTAQQQTLIDEFSAAASVDKSLVSITEIKAGSIIVELAVAPTPAQTEADLTKSLVDLVAAGNVASSISSFTVSKVVIDDPNVKNFTPYVRQVKSGFWEAGVPQYGEENKPTSYFKKEFSSESDATNFVRVMTGTRG